MREGESTRSVTAGGSGTTGTRIMIDDEPLGPDDLRITREAFDGAWAKIAARYDAGSVDAARERLAKIIVIVSGRHQRPGRDKGRRRAGDDEGRLALRAS